ncbi:MAG: glucans biosynthesis glucosyltransferase MdoH [Alphaproteobacteria bacterium]
MNRFLPGARGLLLLLVAATTGLAAALITTAASANGISALEATIVIATTLSVAWLALSFWTAAFGFAARLAHRDTTGITAPADAPLTSRTAVVMPVYNEDPAATVARAEATLRSLRGTMPAGSFAFFALSDTTDAETAATEERAWASLGRRLAGSPAVFYRRRPHNIGRKAGNIADFCRRWGAAYDFMLVLDADSTMHGATVARLVRLMQANPRAGIIQTLPLAVGHDSLFARLHQFAGRLVGPMLAAGAAVWQRGDANYYGHNAIIRIDAFARHCALPPLPGRAPLGGEIMSHDFVEAALMRRAGYTVWLDADATGSWEEMPSNVIDYAIRDRRWCVGNLQHLRLLRVPGLRPLSRLHLLCGAFAYLASPVWFALIALSAVDVAARALAEHIYFAPGPTLFPVWPVVYRTEIELLLALIATLLFAPKAMALALALAWPEVRRGFGGAARLFGGTLAEVMLSALMAPATMVFHTRFVAATLAGAPVGWLPQPRDNRGLSWREAFIACRDQTILGLLLAVAIGSVAPEYLPWFAPVLIGLLFAAPIAVLTSQGRLGRRLRRAGLFATPEETSVPTPLRLAAAARQAGRPLNLPDRVARPARPPAGLPELAPLEMVALPFDAVAPRPVRVAAVETARGRPEPRRPAPRQA